MQATESSEPFLSGPRKRRFVALQAQLVPSSAELAQPLHDQGLALVDDLVGRMPPANRRKLAVFLLLIDVMSVVLFLRRFDRAPEAGRRRLLQFLFDGPVGLLRKGFWGLNSLAKLSVYGLPPLYDRLGYRVRENPDD